MRTAQGRAKAACVCTRRSPEKRSVVSNDEEITGWATKRISPVKTSTRPLDVIHERLKMVIEVLAKLLRDGADHPEESPLLLRRQMKDETHYLLRSEPEGQQHARSQDDGAPLDHFLDDRHGVAADA